MIHYTHIGFSFTLGLPSILIQKKKEKKRKQAGPYHVYEYCSPVAMVSVSRHVAHSRQSSSANRNIYFSFNNYNRFLKALSKDLFPSPLFFIHEKKLYPKLFANGENLQSTCRDEQRQPLIFAFKIFILMLSK